MCATPLRKTGPKLDRPKPEWDDWWKSAENIRERHGCRFNGTKRRTGCSLATEVQSPSQPVRDRPPKGCLDLWRRRAAGGADFSFHLPEHPVARYTTALFDSSR